MKHRLFGALIVSASLAAGGQSAVAAQNSVLPADGNLAGYEIRVNLPGAYTWTDHLWRFKANGIVNGVSSFTRVVGPRGTYSETSADTGRWTIENGAVCVVFGGRLAEANGCYTVRRTSGQHMIMTPVNGSGVYKGTITPMNR